jgi:hypothetical protein
MVAEQLRMGVATLERLRRRFVEEALAASLRERPRQPRRGASYANWASTTRRSTAVVSAWPTWKFSLLSLQCLNRRTGDWDTFATEVAAWHAAHNEQTATVRWQLIVDDARRKQLRLYPT